MKIVLLSDPNSVHTQKWAISLAQQSLQVYIIGLSDNSCSTYNSFENIQVFNLKNNSNSLKIRSELIHKVGYLKTINKLKKIINKINPDILHAHYASSYGLLGALTGFHPFILSVWGSDVFAFPKKSFVHKMILKYNFKKADVLLSTSKVMAEESKQYTDKEITIIPFGIDLEFFRPLKKEKKYFKPKDIVIGIIKSLEKEYGINYLIEAFSILKKRASIKNIKLLIVGSGSLQDRIKKQVSDLGLNKDTIFTGKVDYSDLPTYHNNIDIAVFPSLAESFGVAILEASACETAVVVSDVGGLPEVVEDKSSGFIVPSKDPEALANSIEKLIFNKELRQTMGIAGRARVQKLYNWNNNVKQMLEIYYRYKNTKKH